MTEIKAVIGLGNIGPRYAYTRHNIGFLVLDTLADRWGASWRETELMDVAHAQFGDKNIFLIKPRTYMNNSGKVLAYVHKKGIKQEEVLVVHDELEFPFGKIGTRTGGSARGHNGIKSLIELGGDNFTRLRCGIGRPETREEVAGYVLSDFVEGEAAVTQMVNQACQQIETLCKL